MPRRSCPNLSVPPQLARKRASGTPASGHSSTIADQRQNNPALTQDEQSYVDELIAGLSAYPSYCAHMGVINMQGPDPVDLAIPELVDPHELRRRIEAGE
jgi:hydroxyacylglutathione hydrolase